MQVLQKRQPYLANVVQYKLYRGIAPEQYQEMEAIFKTYDKDSSKDINEKELRSCLFSLGEERTKKEVAGYMKQFGRNGGLSFEPFRELMITLLGDAGTADGLLESFRLLSQGAPGITVRGCLRAWMTALLMGACVLECVTGRDCTVPLCLLDVGCVPCRRSA